MLVIENNNMIEKQFNALLLEQLKKFEFEILKKINLTENNFKNNENNNKRIKNKSIMFDTIIKNFVDNITKNYYIDTKNFELLFDICYEWEQNIKNF